MFWFSVGSVSLRCPAERHFGGGEVCEGLGYLTVMDESAVEIGEIKEMLKMQRGQATPSPP